MFGIVIAVIVGSVGKKALEPDKLVRIIFPYIRRSGDSTVVFGYILREDHVKKLFWFVLLIIFSITWIFFTNILIQYSGNNNPYADSSIEVGCFFDKNKSRADLSQVERFHKNKSRANLSQVEQLEGKIDCFAINFNIAAAMSQAASMLALGWLVVSIPTWAKLNADKIKDIIKDWWRELKNCCPKVRNACCCTVTELDHCKIFVVFIVCIIIFFVFVLSFVFKYEYIATLIQLLLIIIILLSTIFIVLDTNIKKEPKTLEDYCKENLKEPPKDGIKKNLLIEMAILEFKKLLASRYINNIESDEEMAEIINTAYEEIKKLPVKSEEEEQSTAPENLRTAIEVTDRPGENSSSYQPFESCDGVYV